MLAAVSTKQKILIDFVELSSSIYDVIFMETSKICTE